MRVFSRSDWTERNWFWPSLLGLGLGVASAYSAQATLVAVLVLAAGALALRSGLGPEVLVGLYWLVFCLYESIFAAGDVPGLFYPFYAAFLLVLLVNLALGRVRVPHVSFWWYAALILLVLVSFVGFSDLIGFAVIQRVIAHAIALLIFLQFRSHRGFGFTLGAVVLTGVSIAAWVITNAAQSGFNYRGDIEANENVVSFYVGLGLVTALAVVFDAPVRGAVRRLGFPLLLLSGVMLYGMLLLASRGMMLALGLATVAVVIKMALRRRERLWLVVLLVALAGGAFFLPGGQSLLERVTSGAESTDSAGGRLPLWTATWDSFQNGTVKDYLIGFGFDSSSAVVERVSGYLTSTHNGFLQVLYEFGLLGLLAFLGLHLVLIRRSWAMDAPLGTITFGLLIFLLCSNLTTDTPDGFIYWTAIGLILALATWAPTRPSKRFDGGRS